MACDWLRGLADSKCLAVNRAVRSSEAETTASYCYNLRTMENPNLPSPHNNYFHFALSHLPNARSLIESQMPAEVLRELKLETLATVPGSFVASDLRDRHSDLLLSVELADPVTKTKRKAIQRALIYMLLEHKSEPDPLTVLQLLAYVVRIWEKLIRDGLSLCPIIPLVVYHGESRWTVAKRISELIPAPLALAEFQVQFGFPLLDLSQLSDEQIPGDQLLQSALGLLKYSRSSQLPDKLRSILQLLSSSLGDQPVEVWIRAIGVYVMAVNKQIESGELHKIVQSVFPTQIEPGSLADRLLNQGREEGIEQGLLAGKIQTLQELLCEPISGKDDLKTRTLEELTELSQELQSRLRQRDT